MSLSVSKCTKFALILLIFSLPLVSKCQDLSMAILQSGPFGKPALVRDVFDHWSIPISVYTDNDVELFVHDITSQNWIGVNEAYYKGDGKFMINLYSFFKNDHDCRKHRIPAGHESEPEWIDACGRLRYERQLIVVDIRNKSFIISRRELIESDANIIIGSVRYSKEVVQLDKALDIKSHPLFQSITLITSIVVKEMNAQQEHEKYVPKPKPAVPMY